MQGFIDTHCHLAWDIDDGMENEKNAMIALENASRDGITAIIATPHFVPGIIDKEMYLSMNRRIKELQQLAKGYDISIYSGCELFLNHEYLDVLDSGFVNTLADTDYLLVEFDVRKNMKHNEDAEDMLYEIQVRNKVPVIAHAERYFHDGVDIKRIKEWISMGCYIQVNRTSILGHHGYTAMKNAEQLIHCGLAHIIASDAHSCNGNRVCKLSDVYRIINDDYGKETADLLCINNPQHILHNEEMEAIPKVEKVSLFGKLWKRGK